MWKLRRFSNGLFQGGEIHQSNLGIIFSGQGSQFTAISKIPFSETSKKLFEEASDIVGFSLQEASAKIGTDENFQSSQIVQPLIVTHSIVEFKSLFPDLPLNSIFIGHSLGHYSALCASQSISFAEAIHLVHQRGILMDELLKKNFTKKYSLVALASQKGFESTNFIQEFPFFCEIACINSNRQLVVVIEPSDLYNLKKHAKNCQIIPLNGQIPFHTSLLHSIAQEFRKELAQIAFKRPKIPVISNVTAKFLELKEIQQDLIEHFYKPVQFKKSLELAFELGIRNVTCIGPSSAAFTKLIQRDYSQMKISSKEK